MADPSKLYNSHDAIKPQALTPSLSFLNLASPPGSAALGPFRLPHWLNTQSLGRPGHPSSSSSPPATLRDIHPHSKAPCRGPSLGPGKLETLKNFRHASEVDGGSLEVRLMAPEDMDATVKLLAEAFADAVRLPPRQIRFLQFRVELCLAQIMQQYPHVAILVALYRAGDGAAEPRLAATAKVSFDEMAGCDDIPTPAPPRGAPYISNIAVDKAFRRCTSPPPISSRVEC